MRGPDSFRAWAAEWVRGRRSDAPPEVIEFLLLRELPGYTRRDLEAEPAAIVMRWLILLEARQAYEAAEARKARAGTSATTL